MFPRHLADRSLGSDVRVLAQVSQGKEVAKVELLKVPKGFHEWRVVWSVLSFLMSKLHLARGLF